MYLTRTSCGYVALQFGRATRGVRSTIIVARGELVMLWVVFIGAIILWAITERLDDAPPPSPSVNEEPLPRLRVSPELQAVVELGDVEPPTHDQSPREHFP
jgi:hypothetical protein